MRGSWKKRDAMRDTCSKYGKRHCAHKATSISRAFRFPEPLVVILLVFAFPASRKIAAAVAANSDAN